MEIVSINKTGLFYKVKLDNEQTYKFHESVIIKYGFIRKKIVVKESILEKALRDNEYYLALDKGANYLSSLRSKYDTYLYLKKHFSEEICKNVIEKLIELKKTMPCKKCGCQKHYLIDFHHIDPAEKNFTISKNPHAKFETLLKEIEKCIPLCSNCHREFHYLEKEQGITLIEYLNGGME